MSVYDSSDGAEGRGAVSGLLSGAGAWTTYQYCTQVATHDGMAKNTGVVFDLGTATRLAGLTVKIGTPGASLEVWAADPSVTAMPAVRPGQPPAGFTKVEGASDIGSSAALTFADLKARFVLIWFTGPLPAVPNPDKNISCPHNDDHRYGDSITAVQFTRG